MLIVENHKLCFDITHILSVVLGFFPTKHGIRHVELQNVVGTLMDQPQE